MTCPGFIGAANQRITGERRKVTPWGKGPKYLLHERDSKFGRKFTVVAASSGIKEIKSPIRTPKVNAVCERVIGSLNRECLDHMLIWNRSQIHRLVKAYTVYHNGARPHQGFNQRIPDSYSQIHPTGERCPRARITSKPSSAGSTTITAVPPD